MLRLCVQEQSQFFLNCPESCQVLSAFFTGSEMSFYLHTFLSGHLTVQVRCQLPIYILTLHLYALCVLASTCSLDLSVPNAWKILDLTVPRGISIAWAISS